MGVEVLMRAPLVVAGLNTKKLHPRVWDPESPYYLPELEAVMFTFADFYRHKDEGPVYSAHKRLSEMLGSSAHVAAYVDNGSFVSREYTSHREASYLHFVAVNSPEWAPVPWDAIPAYNATLTDQQDAMGITLAADRSYLGSWLTPVAHVGAYYWQYVQNLKEMGLAKGDTLAVGGAVPYLKASAFRSELLESFVAYRKEFSGLELHGFGVLGALTLHLAAVVGLDSVDSATWQVHAAYGLIIHSRGEVSAVSSGRSKKKRLTRAQRAKLGDCRCPSCSDFSVVEMEMQDTKGFCLRATHNLHYMLQEAGQVAEHQQAGDYEDWVRRRVKGTRVEGAVRHVLTSHRSEQTRLGE